VTTGYDDICIFTRIGVTSTYLDDLFPSAKEALDAGIKAIPKK
jgi:hypothetical protein